MFYYRKLPFNTTHTNLHNSISTICRRRKDSLTNTISQLSYNRVTKHALSIICYMYCSYGVQAPSSVQNNYICNRIRSCLILMIAGAWGTVFTRYTDIMRSLMFRVHERNHEKYNPPLTHKIHTCAKETGRRDASFHTQ